MKLKTRTKYLGRQVTRKATDGTNSMLSMYIDAVYLVQFTQGRGRWAAPGLGLNSVVAIVPVYMPISIFSWTY